MCMTEGRGNGWLKAYKWESVDHDELQVSRTWWTGSSHGWRVYDMKHDSGIGGESMSWDFSWTIGLEMESCGEE